MDLERDENAAPAKQEKPVQAGFLSSFGLLAGMRAMLSPVPKDQASPPGTPSRSVLRDMNASGSPQSKNYPLLAQPGQPNQPLDAAENSAPVDPPVSLDKSSWTERGDRTSVASEISFVSAVSGTENNSSLPDLLRPPYGRLNGVESDTDTSTAYESAGETEVNASSHDDPYSSFTSDAFLNDPNAYSSPYEVQSSEIYAEDEGVGISQQVVSHRNPHECGSVTTDLNETIQLEKQPLDYNNVSVSGLVESLGCLSLYTPLKGKGENLHAKSHVTLDSDVSGDIILSPEPHEKSEDNSEAKISESLNHTFNEDVIDLVQRDQTVDISSDSNLSDASVVEIEQTVASPTELKLLEDLGQTFNYSCLSNSDISSTDARLLYGLEKSFNASTTGSFCNETVVELTESSLKSDPNTASAEADEVATQDTVITTGSFLTPESIAFPDCVAPTERTAVPESVATIETTAIPESDAVPESGATIASTAIVGSVVITENIDVLESVLTTQNIDVRESVATIESTTTPKGVAATECVADSESVVATKNTDVPEDVTTIESTAIVIPESVVITENINVLESVVTTQNIDVPESIASIEITAIPESVVLSENTDVIESVATVESTAIQEGVSTTENTDVIESVATVESTAIQEGVSTTENTDVIERAATIEITAIPESVVVSENTDVLESVVTTQNIDIPESVATADNTPVPESVTSTENIAVSGGDAFLNSVAEIPIKCHRTFEELLEAELAAQENPEQAVPSSSISGTGVISSRKLNESFAEIISSQSTSVNLESEPFPTSDTGPIEVESETNEGLDSLIKRCKLQEQDLQKGDSAFGFVAAEASRLSLSCLNASTHRPEDSISSDNGNQTVIMVDSEANSISSFSAACEEGSSSLISEVQVSSGGTLSHFEQENFNLEEEEFQSGDAFKDPSAFDYLSLHGGFSSARDLRKESLYVKFDPLFGLLTSDMHPKTSSHSEEVKTTDSEGAQQEEGHNASDKLISLSPSGNKQAQGMSTPNKHKEGTPVKTPAHVMLNETLQSFGSQGVKQEELIQKLQEHQLVLEEQDKAYQERIVELEQKMKEMELQRLQEVKEKDKQLQEKVHSVGELNVIMKEYEKTISRLVAEKSQEKKLFEEKYEDLLQERNQAQQHLNNMEIAFADIHTKYERLKSVVETFKKNEETLNAALSDKQAGFDKMQRMYEMLKSHAVGKLEKANQDLETIKQKHHQENAKLIAMVKKLEVKTKSLEETLEQKAKENQALTAICDELINKVGE